MDSFASKCTSSEANTYFIHSIRFMVNYLIYMYYYYNLDELNFIYNGCLDLCLLPDYWQTPKDAFDIVVWYAKSKL